jgi:hypothetical protein
MNPSDRFLRFAAECEVMAKFTSSPENEIVWHRMAAMDTMCRIDRTARFGSSRCWVNEKKSETYKQFDCPSAQLSI